MLSTIVCAITLIMYFAGVLMTPKRKKYNGFELLIIGTILLMIAVGIWAVGCNFVGIPVSLNSTAVIIAVIDVLLWVRCIRKKEVAHCEWKLLDAVSLFIVILPVVIVSIRRFGVELNLNYTTSLDPARYLQYAMSVVRSGQVYSEFMTDLVNALFIMFFQPFLPAISYYRAFVLADIYMHVLSVAMFYLLVSKVNRGKAKWCNAILTILYFGGYPLYNLCFGSFFHWVDGVLMTMFLIYAALLLEREEISHAQGILYLLGGLFGLCCFYPFLLVIVGPIFLPEVIIWCKDNLKKLPKKQLIILGVAAVIVLGIAVIMAGARIGHSWQGLMTALTGDEALAYREPYMDFLFFVPVLFSFLGLLHRHKKENRMIGRMVITGSVFTTIWFILFLNGFMVSYYYYRVYFVLWLLAWLMSAQTIEMMVKEKKNFEVAAYSAFYGIALILSVGGINKKIDALDERLFRDESSVNTNLFPLYSYNAEVLRGEFKSIFTEEELQVYNFVMDNLQTESVPAVTSFYSAVEAMWYQGITGQSFDKYAYDTDYNALYRVMQNLENDGKNYFMMLKKDLLYYDFKAEVFDHFEVVYETDGGVVLKRPAEGWTAAIDQQTVFSEEEKTLFANIQDSGIRPWLVYDTEDEKIAKYYEIYAGGEPENWINKCQPEEFISRTYQLNLDEVEYLTVMKDSEMYLANQEYFDAQQVIWETERVLVIHYAGEGWMPSEQE